jgi:hypothetical protein
VSHCINWPLFVELNIMTDNFRLVVASLLIENRNHVEQDGLGENERDVRDANLIAFPLVFQVGTRKDTAAIRFRVTYAISRVRFGHFIIYFHLSTHNRLILKGLFAG